MYGSQVISRTELFERVWTKPVMELGAELGISGTGLKKLCERHGIPVPERGYWNKVQAGKRVRRRPPLPPAKPGHSDHIVMRNRPAKAADG